MRVQQRRTKGWKKPDNTVSVARPSKWGNPYSVAKWGQLLAVHGFSVALFEGRLVRISVDDVRRELAGKNLMCFCPLDQPCHADVLLAIANPPRCPECRDGKHRNCIGEALADDDTLVPCGCPEHEESPCAS